MRTLILAAGMALATGSSWAEPATPLRQMPFAGYGDARVRHDCTMRSDDAPPWIGECHLSGALVGRGFSLPMDHVFRFGSAGCAIELPGARTTAEIACKPGRSFGSYVEFREILGTECRAEGVLWSTVSVATEAERGPAVTHLVKVEMELVIKPGQAACEAGLWNETRYYLVCAERPTPALGWVSANERVCATGVELLLFEAVHWKPEGTDEDDPWHRRLYAQVRS